MGKFNDLINSGKPVLVDFYAEWCAPCKAMAPVLKDVASLFGDRVHVLKVDVDKNPAAAAKYEVRSVPSFILFRNGQVRWKSSGVLSAAQLASVIDKQLMSSR